MRGAWKAVLYVALGLIVFGCGDSDETDPTVVTYTGYTKTDELGTILAEDVDDWQLCGEADGGGDVPPARPGMQPAFPNETNGPSTIEYGLLQAAEVSISIWQASGGPDGGESLVTTLVDRVAEAGVHRVTWQGRDPDGQRLAPGLYRCRLVTDDCEAAGDIKIVDCPYGTDRLLAADMLAFLEEHWSLERLDAAFDPNYMSRPDAIPEYETVAGDGWDYFRVLGYHHLPQWVPREDDLSLFVENVAMWDQFVFGWDDFVDPRSFLSTDEVDIANLRDPRTSASRQTYRGDD